MEENLNKINIAVTGLGQTIKVQQSILEDIKELLEELQNVNNETIKRLEK